MVDLPLKRTVLSEIEAERDRQDLLKAQGKFRWTLADTRMPCGTYIDASKKLAVIAEEFGEVSRVVCESLSGPLDRAHLREELVQVAACCLAWCESLDPDGGAV